MELIPRNPTLGMKVPDVYKLRTEIYTWCKRPQHLARKPPSGRARMSHCRPLATTAVGTDGGRMGMAGADRRNDAGTTRA